MDGSAGGGYTYNPVTQRPPKTITKNPSYDPTRDSLRAKPDRPPRRSSGITRGGLIGGGTAAGGARRTSSAAGGGGAAGGIGAIGGGGGSFGANALAAPIFDPNAWKTDSSYLAQLAALDKALKDYKAQQLDSQNRYQVDFAGRTRDLGIERAQSLDNNSNDYASRGLFNSGLMVDATGRLVDAYARRQGDMETARANFLAGLQTDFTNFQTEQDLTRQKAQQDAIARAAAGVTI